MPSPNQYIFQNYKLGKIENQTPPQQSTAQNLPINDHTFLYHPRFHSGSQVLSKIPTGLHFFTQTCLLGNANYVDLDTSQSLLYEYYIPVDKHFQSLPSFLNEVILKKPCKNVQSLYKLQHEHHQHQPNQLCKKGF